MSDYDDNHNKPTRFVHVVLRVPDNADDQDIQTAMGCLYGHMRDGHGMRIANTAEVAKTLLEEGGIERLLLGLKALEEKYGEEEPGMLRVPVGDPFGLSRDDDPVLH